MHNRSWNLLWVLRCPRVSNTSAFVASLVFFTSLATLECSDGQLTTIFAADNHPGQEAGRWILPPSMPISLAFAFLDPLLETGKFLLQLLLVVLQGFPPLLGGKEATKSMAASATTAAASSRSFGSMGFSSLMHYNHLPSSSFRVSEHPASTVRFTIRIGG